MPKVILVTGASSGIGKATALKLLAEGHVVYGAARHLKDLKDLKAADGFPLKMDVTDDRQMKAAVKKIITKHKRIDVLVNNAGFGLFGAVEDIPPEDVRYQFEVNVLGLGRLTQLTLPHMRKQKQGTIINISSMGGKMYTPLGAWYHATKHAVEGFSDCLRLELKQFNINVVVIEPGVIGTNFANVMVKPMLKYSGKGPYAKFTKRFLAGSKDTYEKPGASSPPTVIANVIAKAVASPNPKTRYVAGKWARPLMFLRKYGGDRFFDAVLLSQMK